MIHHLPRCFHRRKGVRSCFPPSPRGLGPQDNQPWPRNPCSFWAVWCPADLFAPSEHTPIIRMVTVTMVLRPQFVKLGEIDSRSLEKGICQLPYLRGVNNQKYRQRDEKLQPITHYYKRLCFFEGFNRGLNEPTLFALNLKLMCSFAEGSSGGKSDIFLESDGMK